MAGSYGLIEIFDDFLGPDNDLTWGTGTVKVGNWGFVSVNEGSFEWTVDEPGGIVAITTDTADNDNAALIAGSFKLADGGVESEFRYKYSNVDCATLAGFQETVALDTPVMGAEFATATMTYNNIGTVFGAQYDVDGTTDDFRAVFGDAQAAVSGADANGTRANATLTADRWFVTRTVGYPSGGGEVWHSDVGHIDGNSIPILRLIKRVTSGLDTTAALYALLMIENRSGNARVLEVDYAAAKGRRDWRAS